MDQIHNHGHLEVVVVQVIVVAEVVAKDVFSERHTLCLQDWPLLPSESVKRCWAQCALQQLFEAL